MNKGLVLLPGLIFLAAILLSGCATTEGAARSTVDGVKQVGDGIGKDTVNIYAGLQQIDDWLRKNLW